MLQRENSQRRWYCYAFSHCSLDYANFVWTAVLRKPLQTSIAVEADEFDEIDVEDKLHIVISVKDFRSIIQHAGIAGSDLCARYSLPSKPIQFSYAADAMVCEFLIMTVGERGSQPNQKVKKGQKSTAQAAAPRLEAVSRRTSVAPSEAPQQQQQPQQKPPPELAQAWTPSASARPQASGVPRPAAAVRAGASRMSAFDLRPSQKPPPPTLRSESLFVEDEGWEPVQDEDEDADEGARLGWDHSADPDPVSSLAESLKARWRFANSLEPFIYAPKQTRRDKNVGSGEVTEASTRANVFGTDAKAFRCTRTGVV